MNAYEGNITSKLPQTGISIFAVMTQLATQYKALNLAQGFPDFPVSEHLIELVNQSMKKGFNQYAPMPGIKPLREALSKLFKQNYGAVYNTEQKSPSRQAPHRPCLASSPPWCTKAMRYLFLNQPTTVMPLPSPSMVVW